MFHTELALLPEVIKNIETAKADIGILEYITCTNIFFCVYMNYLWYFIFLIWYILYLLVVASIIYNCFEGHRVISVLGLLLSVFTLSK